MQSSNDLPDEALIGMSDLADWLGVSVFTVKRWCARGPRAGQVPPMIRINGQIRFRPQDVRDWLDAQIMR